MLNILIIEDDFTSMELYTQLIRRILPECRIYQAGNATSAGECMSANMIHVFFIDMELPRISGLTLAKKIRRNPNYVLAHIVFITERGVNELSLYKQFHHYACLIKPFTPEYFISSIRPLLIKMNMAIGKNSSQCSISRDHYVLLEGRNFCEYVNIKQLLYAEFEDGKVGVFTHHKKYYPIQIGLENFLKELGTEYFIRCHKSFALYVPNLIGLDKISRRLWQAKFENKADTYCLIGSTYYAKVRGSLSECRSNKNNL